MEALNFLQYNLRIRRFGLRPTLKFAELAKQTQNYQELRTSKKIYTKNKSPVSIKIFHHNLLNISNENELEKLPKLNSSLKEPKVTQTSMNIAKGNVPSAVPWAVSKRSYGSWYVLLIHNAAFVFITFFSYRKTNFKSYLLKKLRIFCSSF